MNMIKTLLVTILLILSPWGPLYAQMTVKNSSGAELMRVTDDGKVGIGTATPAFTLQVNGGIAGQYLTVGKTLSDSALVMISGYGRDLPNDGYDKWKMGLYAYGSATNQHWSANIQSTVSVDLSSFNSPSAIVATSTYLNEINSGTIATGSLSQVLRQSSNPSLWHMAGVSGYLHGPALIPLFADHPDINRMAAVHASVGSPRPDESKPIYALYATGPKSYLGGKVGINNLYPNYTLDVNGSLNVNGKIFQRGGTLHADYVFEPDFVVPSIDEHSRFMWDKKHLPAVPKAQTDDNGLEVVDMGSHQRGMLEELETAHIYIEQLYKQNKILQKRLDRLETLLNQ